MDEKKGLKNKKIILGIVFAIFLLLSMVVFGIGNQKDEKYQEQYLEVAESDKSVKEQSSVVVEDIIVDKMTSEEMFFNIDEIVRKWENQETDAEQAIASLGEYTQVEYDEVVSFATAKIELITLEMNSQKLYSTAEKFYEEQKYIETLQTLKEIPKVYSKYSKVETLVNLCQKGVLEQVKNPDTVETYEQAIECVEKSNSIFPADNLKERKLELEAELERLRDVINIIQTATDLYDSKKYEEAFAMLGFGLEEYPKNELIEESLVNFHEHFIIQTTMEVAELCKTESYTEALDVIDAAILEYDCDELQNLKVRVREEKNVLYKLKNDVVEAFKFYANEITSEKFDVKQFANNTGTYIVKSGKKLVLGDYAEEDITVLAFTGNVVASLAGVDAFMDLRDLSYDITHWGEEEYFVARLAVDVIALIPVVGAVKYLEHYKVVEAGVNAASDMVDSVADVGKNTEATAEALDAIFDTVKPAYKVIDTADAVNDVAKTRKMANTIRNNASKGYDFVQTGNYKLLDTVHEKTGVKFELKKLKYSTGDMIQGVFPVFKSFSDVNLPKDLYKASFPKQQEYCLEVLQKQVKNPFSKIKNKFTAEELKAIEDGILPEGFTWHHNEKEGLMQLVDSKIHNATNHTGGMSLWGQGYK